jgi:diaphanous 1
MAPSLAYASTECSAQNFHGLVQRLVLKEKQVLHLQAEVDKFKSENPAEGRDAVSRYPPV